jgi:hypothetical protein
MMVVATAIAYLFFQLAELRVGFVETQALEAPLVTPYELGPHLRSPAFECGAGNKEMPLLAAAG